MKIIRRRASYIKWDRKRNEDVLDKPRIKPLRDYIKICQGKWNTRTE